MRLLTSQTPSLAGETRKTFVMMMMMMLLLLDCNLTKTKLTRYLPLIYHPSPLVCSVFARNAAVSEKDQSKDEQLHRQEALIQKLTADLKKEKEESKKKDVALRKYEGFYREVKARSAEKAAQKLRDAAGQRPRVPRVVRK